jgi:hypothetical protein
MFSSAYVVIVADGVCVVFKHGGLALTNQAFPSRLANSKNRIPALEHRRSLDHRTRRRVVGESTNCLSDVHFDGMLDYVLS